MKEDDRYRGTSTYSETTPPFLLERSDPFRMTDMSTLLTPNAGQIQRRLRLGSDASGLGELAGSLRLLALLIGWSRGRLWLGATDGLALVVGWRSRRKPAREPAGADDAPGRPRKAA